MRTLTGRRYTQAVSYDSLSRVKRVVYPVTGLTLQNNYSCFRDGKVDLRQCSSHRLALWLLRDHFEMPLGRELQVDYREARMCRPIHVPELMYYDRMPRLSGRAVMLAIFATTYYRIEKLRHRGFVDDWELRRLDLNSLMPVAGPRFGRFWSAGIFIPVVHGIPLKPFQLHRMGEAIPFLRKKRRVILSPALL